MSIIVLGLNHRSAPVGIRERLAFDSEKEASALRQLRQIEPGAEFVLLSTCNRVELYYAGKQDAAVVAGRLIAFLAGFHGLERQELPSGLYVHEGEDAVRHLLRVSAGLDSMVLGEAQILGQVKESYRRACEAGTSGKVFNRLFHNAFFTAKEIHTTTGISIGRVSVAGVAVELATQLFANLAQAKILVIGAGETGELVVRHLLKAGGAEITVVNRSFERGADLAARLGVAVARWEQLDMQLGQASIVISSVSRPDYLYQKGTFERKVDRACAGTLLMIDLGVPRNFDPDIDELEGVHLYSVDQLAQVAEENLRARQEDLSGGLEIVYAHSAQFLEWLHAKDIGPLIGRMKAEFRRIGRNELKRFFVGRRRKADCRVPMETMVNRVVDKLVHCVIQNVNTVARDASPAEAAKLVDAILQQAREISCDAHRSEDLNA